MTIITSRQFSILLMSLILFVSIDISVVETSFIQNVYGATSQSTNYCFSQQLGGPFSYIKDCGSFKVLVRPCCDQPAVITDQNWNKIAECGGLKGYSKECRERFLPQNQCSTVYCEPAKFPRYGRAPDYSWASGKLTFNPLEGGCWSFKFSENKNDDIFALNFDNQQQISQFKDGDFVVVKGEQEGKKFISIGCQSSVYPVYKVSEIRNNDLSFTPDPQRIEIRRDQEGQIKIVPPTSPSYQKITSEHASEKIVRHGYALIDAYIKELPAPRCTFPDGQFRFWFNSGTGKNVVISPACMPPTGIWRNISFVNIDNTAIITVLDGPISGTPGTPNEEAIRGAISNLSARLSDSKMLVKIIYKNGTPDLNFDLNKETDFQKFIDLMFNTIKLSKPLASGPIPATATLPEGTLINVAPTENKDPVKIRGVSSSFSQMVTNVYFKNDKKEVKIKIDKIKKESLIEIDGKAINTQRGIEIKNSKLYMETATGPKEIRIPPSEVYSKGQEITMIEKIKLTEESQSPVYSVKGTKQAKLLFILPVTLRIETKINAESGEILSVNKPWWSFLTR